MNLEIHQIPVISTAHLSRITAKRLLEEGNDNPWCVCASWEHGYFLHVQMLDAEPDEDGTPQCLVDIQQWLTGLYVDGSITESTYWVRLDSDAAVIPELKTYDW